jgi:hypothetical protein
MLPLGRGAQDLWPVEYLSQVSHTHIHTLTPVWVRDGEGARHRLHERTVFVGRERFAVTAAVEATDRKFVKDSYTIQKKVARALSSMR